MEKFCFGDFLGWVDSECGERFDIESDVVDLFPIENGRGRLWAHRLRLAGVPAGPDNTRNDDGEGDHSGEVLTHKKSLSHSGHFTYCVAIPGIVSRSTSVLAS